LIEQPSDYFRKFCKGRHRRYEIAVTQISLVCIFWNNFVIEKPWILASVLLTFEYRLPCVIPVIGPKFKLEKVTEILVFMSLQFLLEAWIPLIQTMTNDGFTSVWEIGVFPIG
jgi:hypothetical protein